MKDVVDWMLWEDMANNDKKGKIQGKSEMEKILEAIDYYKSKYGKIATIVLINTNSSFSIKKDVIDGVSVKKMRNVMPNNYWIN